MNVTESELPTVIVLIRTARALAALAAAPKSASAMAEAVRWAEPLAAAAERLAAGNAAKGKGNHERNGRPAVGYVVDHEQNGSVVAFGARAVAELIGSTAGAVSVGLSKGGGKLTKLLRERDGDWVVTVRRATDAEEAEALQDMADVGTEDAVSKKRAK